MKNNNISYRQVGDYNIPNLIIPPEEANVTLGKWGMLHKDYLHKHKKVLFTTLLTQGKLYQHCAEVEKQAQQMFDTIVEQMKETESVAEHLKADNQMEWVCRMQNIEARASELVCSSLIYRWRIMGGKIDIVAHKISIILNTFLCNGIAIIRGLEYNIFNS